MTDEERKALAERLRERHTQYGVCVEMAAADQIEADGKRIAELEAALHRVIWLDHHNMGAPSASSNIARAALESGCK